MLLSRSFFLFCLFVFALTILSSRYWTRREMTARGDELIERAGKEPPVQHLTKIVESNGTIRSALVVVTGKQCWLAKKGGEKKKSKPPKWTKTGWIRLCANGTSSVASLRTRETAGRAGMLWTLNHGRSIKAARSGTQGATIHTHGIEKWPWLAERAFTAQPKSVVIISACRRVIHSRLLQPQLQHYEMRCRGSAVTAIKPSESQMLNYAMLNSRSQLRALPLLI